MNKNELTEYADLLMQAAVRKCDSLADAQDLVQETLLAALTVIENGKEITEPKAFLLTVLNRKYYDMLRQKYRKPTVCIDTIEDFADESTACDDPEDAEKIRRLLASLTGIYREVLVQHYMNGKSITEIARQLNIPENTVKNRLFTGRNHIRKEFVMENYTKQSYEPEELFLSISGREGLNKEPWSVVGSDRIRMNLLLLAYEEPLTLPALASAIGISTTYIEPIVDELVRNELMKRVSDKVYTDFVIYTEKDRLSCLNVQLQLAEELCAGIWEVLENGLSELKEREYCQSQSSECALKLESFFLFRTLASSVNIICNEISGGKEPFENYPDRPNGGKWYAMGASYPHGYDHANCPYCKYQFSGECISVLEDFLGCKRISLCNYDTDPDILGKTKENYYYYGSIAKLFYFIHTGQTDLIDTLDRELIKSIAPMIEWNILHREQSGALTLNIPVISMQDRWDIYKLSDKYAMILSGQFHDRLMELMKAPVKLPKHLKSVPKWQRYLYCRSYFPSAVIFNARKQRLFLKGYDKPAPAIMLCVEK